MRSENHKLNHKVATEASFLGAVQMLARTRHAKEGNTATVLTTANHLLAALRKAQAPKCAWPGNAQHC